MAVKLKCICTRKDNNVTYSPTSGLEDYSDYSETLENTLVENGTMLYRETHQTELLSREIVYGFADLQSLVNYLLLMENDTNFVTQKLNDLNYKISNDITRTYSIEID